MGHFPHLHQTPLRCQNQHVNSQEKVVTVTSTLGGPRSPQWSKEVGWEVFLSSTKGRRVTLMF